ncbi:MAG: helix-turn-helix domain-containing protein [Myxococcota bacterium]
MSDSTNSVEISNIRDIGKAIRAERKSQGLTQREFADLVGIGVRFLSELERGKETAEVGLVLIVLENLGFDLVLRKRGWTTPTRSEEKRGAT